MRSAFFSPRAWPWWVLAVLTVVLHLWQLDERSYHHDESIHAKLSWDLAESGAYRYDPTYHGPLLYMVVASTYKFLGDGDFTARLPIALAGIALLGVAWSLRRPFGARAAWWIGLLFTLSPTVLFFGRFLRMDILELATASAAFTAFYAVIRGKTRAWTWVGIWTGLAFATKENAYVTAVVAAGAGLIVALDYGITRSFPLVVAWVRDRWMGFVLSVGIFVLVSVPLYTVGLTRPEDWLFPVKAITHWWQQHSIERVPGPWWFYLPRLLQYEFLILGAALAWVVRRWRKLHPIELFLISFGGLSVGMYAYLGEKVPWLLVHQVWAFVPLAGAQMARTFGPQGRWWSRFLAAAALTATVIVSFTANFVLDEFSPNHPRVESFHFVQTTPEFTAAAKEAAVLGRSGDGPVIGATGAATWPLNWYWRHLPVKWGQPSADDGLQMAFCDIEAQAVMQERLGPEYVGEIVPLRSWFLMYVGEPSLGDWARYFLTREPWGGVGSTEVIVFRRIDGVLPDEDLMYWDPEPDGPESENSGQQ
ncbi:MAG: flippase activity-associated protein Agl23 [Acidobacteriota bacterium]